MKKEVAESAQGSHCEQVSESNPLKVGRHWAGNSPSVMVASEAACETWQESHEKSSEPDSSEVQRYPFDTEASNSVETGCSYSYRSTSDLYTKQK